MSVLYSFLYFVFGKSSRFGGKQLRVIQTLTGAIVLSAMLKYRKWDVGIAEIAVYHSSLLNKLLYHYWLSILEHRKYFKFELSDYTYSSGVSND